jgi:hypothetical protein
MRPIIAGRCKESKVDAMLGGCGAAMCVLFASCDQGPQHMHRTGAQGYHQKLWILPQTPLETECLGSASQ